MADNNILQNFTSLFNIEFVKRIFSVIFFVPIFIFSLYQGGSLIFFLFLLFFLIIMSELLNLFKLSQFKINIIAYSFIASFCIIIFPFYYLTIDNNFLICSYVLISLWIFDTFPRKSLHLKIQNKLSKGKTYSGSISGLISVFLFNLIISNYFYNTFFINLYFIAIIICTLSFIGDACVSLLKRQSNIKDTGTLFIGHGGFLDRMDSFIMVFFFFIIFDIHKLIPYV